MLVFAALPFQGNSAPAFDIGSPSPQYSVQSWQTDSGLPQNTVRAILQTRDGHIWVGTSEGLARFNGAEFTVFNRANTPGFPGAPITALLEAPDGSLWIATDGSGVARLHEGRITRYSAGNGLLSTRVFALALGLDGSIWIGTSSGVDRFKDGKFTQFTETEGLGRNMVRSLRWARSGELWVGTSRGLSVIKNDTVTNDPRIEKLSSQNMRLLYEDAAGARWIVTNSEVVRQQGGTLTRYTSTDGIVPHNVESMVEDRSGTMWFGASDGLFRFERGRFVAEPLRGATGLESIRIIYEDRESNLWLGTNDGLKRIRRTTFTAYGVDEGLSHNMIASVCQDTSGAYWVGTMGGGLNWLSGRTRAVYTKKNGLLSDGIRALCPSRDGGIWVGFDRSGVVRIKDGQTTRHTSDETFNGSIAQALYEDGRGTLWIGTRNGLCSLKDGNLVNHTKNGGLDAINIRAFAEDTQGGLWIGTSTGLVRYKDGQFFALRKEHGLPSGSIRALLADRDGVLWIGTNGGGLNWMKEGRLSTCTTKQGLYDDTIFDIVDDDRGHLWITSRQGVFRTAKQDLQEVGSGVRARVECIAFNQADGIPGVEGSGSAKPAAWKSADGRLWFATVKALVTVDPSRLKMNDVPPPVVITRLRVDGADVPLNQLTRLPPGHGELEFAYAALSYAQPERIRFKYKLEGVNENWVSAGARQVANYSRVPPGRHRFQVQAMNNDGVWNLTGASFEFFLAPRFYQTGWFYTALAAFAGAGVYGAYSMRVRSLRNREKQLVALVQERTAHLDLEINDRKRAEESLKGSEALYHSLVEILPVNIYRKDKAGRFIFVNEPYCTSNGRLLGDIIGKTDFDLYPPEVAKECRADDEQAMATLQPVAGEMVEVRPDGQKRWFDFLKVAVVDGQGGITGTQGLLWDVTARKRAEEEVTKAHRKLVDLSRQAGMADVATGVLHNVGNVLNSVNVSATLIVDRLRDSKAANLPKIGAMLQERAADLAEFLTSDPKGQRIPGYLIALASELAAEREAVGEELDHLRKNIEHIKDIVAMQQSYAKVSGVAETVAISEVVEDALRMNASALARHGLEVVRAYEPGLTVTVERHKVLQILVNLIRNAKYACDDSGRADKRVTVRIARAGERVRIAVIDNGVGILPENLTRIFAHGFTTRKEGHGFGLHSGALAAKELGGALNVHSDGPGKGAVFTLDLPSKNETPST